MPMNLSANSVFLGAMMRIGGEYHVPPYQRDYAWDEDKLRQMWDDIGEIIFGNNDSYFLGSMVFTAPNPNEIEVIDGQQRLTTMSVLLCALRDLLGASGDYEDEQRELTSILGVYDWEISENNPKLKLNTTNRSFYRENILNNSSHEALAAAQTNKTVLKSNRLLAQAYTYFYERIGQLSVPGMDIRGFTAQLVNALDTKINVIQINVENEFDAYQLFETLNDRGLALSVADLIKNYLLRKASSNEDRLEEVQENWNAMINSLGQRDTKRFLRHYWLSTEGVIRDKDLYDALSRNFDSLARVRTVSKCLRDAADIYGALDDIDSDWWTTFDPPQRRQIQVGIHRLNIFRVTQCYPLLLATLETAEPLFPDVLKLVVNFSFRYSVVGSFSSNVLEAAYSDAARFVRANDDVTLPNIFNRLRDIYPNDAQFQEDFSQVEITNGPLARYILRTVNDELAGDTGVKTEDDPDKVNLEHILPKSIPDHWKATFPDDERPPEDYVHRLGNLTLLQKRLNTVVKNEDFEAKKAGAFDENPYEISQYILEQDIWGPDQIEERQRNLAAAAPSIWSVDY